MAIGNWFTDKSNNKDVTRDELLAMMDDAVMRGFPSSLEKAIMMDEREAMKNKQHEFVDACYCCGWPYDFCECEEFESSGFCHVCALEKDKHVTK